MYVWISEVMQEGDGVMVFASALPYLVIKSDIVILYLTAKIKFAYFLFCASSWSFRNRYLTSPIFMVHAHKLGISLFSIIFRFVYQSGTSIKFEFITLYGPIIIFGFFFV